MNSYGLKIWSEDNFFIEDGLIKLNHASKPAFLDIYKNLKSQGFKGPLLLRFPHLIKKQIATLFNTFEHSIKEYNYKGSFSGVFPLKVNQVPNFLFPLLRAGKKYAYGLEAGSKAELVLAMAYNNLGAHIMVNGFKDKEMIHMAFLAKKMGHKITLTIEGLNELETILEVIKETKMTSPDIGLRIRLHTSGSGIWAKSGGINSKFGLNATEILQAFKILEDNALIDLLRIIHFHIGSSISSIQTIKKAIKETGNIYAELKKLGAKALDSINIGGGLGVEYSQFEKTKQYSLEEFSNDIVFLLKEIALQKNVKEPNIFTESGRFIAASSAVLLAPVLELFSSEYEYENLKLKKQNPKLISELYDLYLSLNKKYALEYMHDSLDCLESLLTLFDLGYIDLQDRSNAEILTNLIIKKALELVNIDDYSELKKIDEKIQEKYLVNFSIFQSLPDLWGIDQEFPIMPISHLDKNATRSASLWDITCDSDGEISFNDKKPLYLHDINLKKEEYILGFFNVGAYQDTLGMKHNLFSHPSEVLIEFDKKGQMKTNQALQSQKIIDILEDLDYDILHLEKVFKSKLDDKSYKILKQYLEENNYLKTICS